MIFLVGPGFEPLILKHDLLVGPGDPIVCFRPVVSVAYVNLVWCFVDISLSFVLIEIIPVPKSSSNQALLFLTIFE